MPNKYVRLQKIAENTPLYHYTKSNGVQGIIKDRAFYATKSNFLNDTNEIYYTFSVVKEVINELPKEEWREVLNRQVAEYRTLIKNQSYYITSFSVDPDSITLWSEFGDKTGYNLEFDSTELTGCIGNKRKLVYHGYLIYSKKEQKAIIRQLLTKEIPESIGTPLEEILEEAGKASSSGAMKKFSRAFRKAISIYAIFFKQEEFAAEKEYRMVFKEKEQGEIRFREKDGFLMPYITVDFGNDKGLIKKVTVAPKNHVDLAKAGMQMFLEHYGYEVKVCLSNIHLRY